MYEIYVKSSTLAEARPFDPPWIEHWELEQGIDSTRARALLQTAAEKISSLPLECFVLMEFLRLAHMLE